MLARTHTNFGLSFGLTSLYIVNTVGAVTLNPVLSVVYLYFVYQGSFIPDLDHRGSTIGRKHPILSWIVSKLFGHRKFTHSLLFILLFSMLHFMVVTGVLLSFLIAGIALGLNEFFIKDGPLVVGLFLSFGLAVGMFSHVVGDSMTKHGVRILSPFTQKKYKLPFTFATGGLMEQMLSILFVLFNLAVSVYLIYLYVASIPIGRKILHFFIEQS